MQMQILDCQMGTSHMRTFSLRSWSYSRVLTSKKYIIPDMNNICLFVSHNEYAKYSTPAVCWRYALFWCFFFHFRCSNNKVHIVWLWGGVKRNPGWNIGMRYGAIASVGLLLLAHSAVKFAVSLQLFNHAIAASQGCKHFPKLVWGLALFILMIIIMMAMMIILVIAIMTTDNDNNNNVVFIYKALASKWDKYGNINIWHLLTSAELFSCIGNSFHSPQYALFAHTFSADK